MGVLRSIYEDGYLYGAQVLNINMGGISKKLQFAATRIACVSLVIGYPTCPSVSHSLARGFKNLLSLAATDIEFERAKEIKDLLNMDPEALAALQAASAPAASAPAADAAPAKVEEEEEESDDEMGFGLFD